MSSLVSFSVRDWSAWAPGLEGRLGFQAWDGQLPQETTVNPKISEFNGMLMRRASRADKLALRAALNCAPQQPIPTVFASRHGEVHRSVELLEALAKGEAPSPTSFSLSVHNAAAGFFSLGRTDLSASSSVASGRDTLPMAMIEACGLLSDGHPQVLVVAYDDAIPRPFAPYLDEPDWALGLALLLEADGQSRLSLELLEGAAEQERPHLLEFLRFLSAEQQTELTFRHERRGWRWRRSN